MNKSIYVVIAVALLALIFSACEQGDSQVAPMQSENQDGLASQPLAKVGRTMIWADCIVYESIVTPAKFKATSKSFDELYAGGGFMDGLGLISESKPGDQDYNGGRWHLNLLKADVPEGKYTEACSVEDLDLNDFEAQDVYFECPLLPRKN
jgi:hypothetical protein